MPISKLKIKLCKLAPTITTLCTHNFVYTFVHAKPFYMHKNQCTQILNLSSPVEPHIYCFCICGVNTPGTEICWVFFGINIKWLNYLTILTDHLNSVCNKDFKLLGLIFYVSQYCFAISSIHIFEVWEFKLFPQHYWNLHWQCCSHQFQSGDTYTFQWFNPWFVHY